MKIPKEPQAISQAAESLAGILDQARRGPTQVTGQVTGIRVPESPWKITITDGDNTAFCIAWQRSGSQQNISFAIHQMQESQHLLPRDAVPVLATTHMGANARETCARHQVNWLDLSGNAHIIAPGLFYQNTGTPNAFVRPGRPETAFGPKGSRITRWLLTHQGPPVTQRTLARLTGLNEGHTSRIISRLTASHLVERSRRGLSVPNPRALMESWRDEYNFNQHETLRGHLTPHHPVDTANHLHQQLAQAGIKHAFTALPAAWLHTHHAGYRTTTAYVTHIPDVHTLRDLGIRPEPRGANIWLTVPNDNAVWEDMQTIEDLPSVHPLQAWLDLKDHPERSQEAAEQLQNLLLPTTDSHQG